VWHSIVDDVTIIDASAYDKAVDNYVGRVREFPGIVEVVRFGGVSNPGISDLDLIVIVEDLVDIAPSNLSNLEVRRNSVESVWTHEVSVIPKSLWSDLQYLAYCSDMQLQLGELAIQEPTLNRNDIFVAMYDGLIDRLICIARVLCSDICSVRYALLVMYSLKHTLRLCEQINIPVEKDQVSLVDEIRELRDTWFEDKKPEALHDLAGRCLSAFHKLACAAPKIFSEDMYSEKTAEPETSLQIGIDVRFRFDSNDVTDVVLSKKRIPFPGRSINLTRISFALPSEAYWQYVVPCFDAMTKSESSQYIDWRASPKRSFKTVENALEKAFLRRHSAIAKHTSYLRHRKFNFGTVHPTASLPVVLRPLGFVAQSKRSLRHLVTKILL